MILMIFWAEWFLCSFKYKPNLTLLMRSHLSRSFDITAAPKPYLWKTHKMSKHHLLNQNKLPHKRKSNQAEFQVIFYCHNWNNLSTYWVSFASSMASSSVLNVLTHRTGPKTSSLHICIEVVTSVMMVGWMKNPFFRCCAHM